MNSQPNMPDLSALLTTIEQNTATNTQKTLSTTAQADDPGAPSSAPVDA